MNPKEAESWYTIFYTLAMTWWFIRSFGVAFISYGFIMMYKSRLYNTTDLPKEKIDKKAKGVVVAHHITWTLVSTWVARRDFFISMELKDVDLVIIEMLFFLSASLVIHQIWDKGLGPLSDKYLGTNFSKKIDKVKK